MKPRRTLVVLAAVILACAAAWYGLAPGETPPGQPALVTIDAGGLQTLRAAFNRDADRSRLIVLLSPT